MPIQIHAWSDCVCPFCVDRDGYVAALEDEEYARRHRQALVSARRFNGVTTEDLIRRALDEAEPRSLA